MTHKRYIFRSFFQYLRSTRLNKKKQQNVHMKSLSTWIVRFGNSQITTNCEYPIHKYIIVVWVRFDLPPSRLVTAAPSRVMMWNYLWYDHVAFAPMHCGAHVFRPGKWIGSNLKLKINIDYNAYMHELHTTIRTEEVQWDNVGNLNTGAVQVNHATRDQFAFDFAIFDETRWPRWIMHEGTWKNAQK